MVLASGAEFDPDTFRAFLAEQPDLGPKQWPSYVRVSSNLPRTATFKVLKRQLSAEGLDCDDPVCRFPGTIVKQMEERFRGIRADGSRRRWASQSLPPVPA